MNQPCKVKLHFSLIHKFHSEAFLQSVGKYKKFHIFLAKLVLLHIGLPTKDETPETTVQNLLYLLVPCAAVNLFFSLHLIWKITKGLYLKQKPYFHLRISIIIEFDVVIKVSFLKGNPKKNNVWRVLSYIRSTLHYTLFYLRSVYCKITAVHTESLVEGVSIIYKYLFEEKRRGWILPKL